MGQMRRTPFLILVFLTAWFIVRFVIGGSEDSWICVDGEWVKHGNPGADVSEESCIE